MSGIYYHFIRINDAGQPYLGHDDNRIVTVGETITVDGEPELCKRGLHASKRGLGLIPLPTKTSPRCLRRTSNRRNPFGLRLSA